MKTRQEWYARLYGLGKVQNVSSSTVSVILDRAKEEMRQDQINNIKDRIMALEDRAYTQPEEEVARAEPKKPLEDWNCSKCGELIFSGNRPVNDICELCRLSCQPAPEEVVDVEMLTKECSDGRDELAKMSEVYEAGLRLGITWRDGRDELKEKYDKLLLLASRVRTAWHGYVGKCVGHTLVDVLGDISAHVAESDPKEEGP
jgi:hypothetical protein